MADNCLRTDVNGGKIVPKRRAKMPKVTSAELCHNPKHWVALDETPLAVKTSGLFVICIDQSPSNRGGNEIGLGVMPGDPTTISVVDNGDEQACRSIAARLAMIWNLCRDLSDLELSDAVVSSKPGALEMLEPMVDQIQEVACAIKNWKPGNRHE